MQTDHVNSLWRALLVFCDLAHDGTGDDVAKGLVPRVFPPVHEHGGRRQLRRINRLTLRALARLLGLAGRSVGVGHAGEYGASPYVGKFGLWSRRIADTIQYSVKLCLAGIRHIRQYNGHLTLGQAFL